MMNLELLVEEAFRAGYLAALSHSINHLADLAETDAEEISLQEAALIKVLTDRYSARLVNPPSLAQVRAEVATFQVAS